MKKSIQGRDDCGDSYNYETNLIQASLLHISQNEEEK